jgi:hypothetical protein
MLFLSFPLSRHKQRGRLDSLYPCTRPNAFQNSVLPNLPTCISAASHSLSSFGLGLASLGLESHGLASHSCLTAVPHLASQSWWCWAHNGGKQLLNAYLILGIMLRNLCSLWPSSLTFWSCFYSHVRGEETEVRKWNNFLKTNQSSVCGSWYLW